MNLHRVEPSQGATPALPGTGATMPRRPFWQQLWFWVIVAMTLGMLLGAYDSKIAVQMAPLGNGFIKLITMLIGPLVFCTMISGMARMANVTRFGTVTLKTLLIFQAMTTASIVIAFAFVDLLRPGAGFHLLAFGGGGLQGYVAQSGRMRVIPFLLNLIPSSYLGAFTDGNILQVLLIAILSGTAIISLGEKAKPLVRMLDIFLEMIYGVIRMVMWTAPIGAFGAIAFGIGTFGIASAIPLGRFIGEFYITCIVIVCALSLPVAAICGFSFLKFLRYFRDEILLCIATTSSEVVLPRIIAKLQEIGCDSAIAGLVVPAGYSFNPTGTSPYLIMVICFLAQAVGKPLDLAQQFELFFIVNLTARSAIGIAGSAFVVLVGTVGMWGPVPIATTALILGIHRLLSQAFVPTFAFTNAISVLAVAKWEKALNLEKLRRTLGRA